jgi:hypothetical protein
LQITLADSATPLQSGGWYLVNGTLNVPDGEGLPAAQLAARTLIACSQPMCADQADAAKIVDRKLAQSGGQ